jgi:hypothetical protein
MNETKIEREWKEARETGKVTGTLSQMVVSESASVDGDDDVSEVEEA